MAAEAMELGPVGAAVASKLRAHRTERRMSQQALGDTMADLGRSRHGSAIARMESGDRRVDVDDLVTISWALRCPVGELLLPDADVSGAVQLTPAVRVPLVDARLRLLSGWDDSTGNAAYDAPETNAAYLQGLFDGNLRGVHGAAEDAAADPADAPLVALSKRVTSVAQRAQQALDGPDAGLHLQAVESALNVLRDEVAILRAGVSSGNH